MALFFIFSVHFRFFFSPLFVTDMSPIVKEYRRILLRITTVFFFGFRKSSRYFLFCRSENISQFIIFSLLLLFLLLLLSLQDYRFSFSLSRYGNSISFLFSVLFVGVCAFRSFFFQHCDPLIAAIFLCGTI